MVQVPGGEHDAVLLAAIRVHQVLFVVTTLLRERPLAAELAAPVTERVLIRRPVKVVAVEAVLLQLGKHHVHQLLQRGQQGRRGSAHLVPGLVEVCAYPGLAPTTHELLLGGGSRFQTCDGERIERDTRVSTLP